MAFRAAPPLVLAFAFAAAAFAADPVKFAVINMEKVFQEYYKTKIADANLKKQADVYKEYSDKLNESLEKLKDEFKMLRDAAQNIALSDVERESKRLAAQDKYRQMKEKEEESKQYSTEKQAQLRDQYDEQRTKLLGEIKDVVQRRAVAEGYSLVLDMSGKTLNNISAVIYFNPASDITDAVIKEINMPADEKDKSATKNKDAEKGGKEPAGENKKEEDKK